MKTAEIQIPNGYELKQVSEDKWELVKSNITLDDILVKSHQYKKSYICTDSDTFVISYKDERLVERLEALSKLQCVANYLNDDWQPNYSDEKEKQYFIAYSYISNSLNVYYRYQIQTGVVGFKSEELAKQAIEICGEDLIKTALGV